MNRLLSNFIGNSVGKACGERGRCDCVRSPTIKERENCTWTCFPGYMSAHSCDAGERNNVPAPIVLRNGGKAQLSEPFLFSWAFLVYS